MGTLSWSPSRNEISRYEDLRVSQTFRNYRNKKFVKLASQEKFWKTSSLFFLLAWSFPLKMCSEPPFKNFFSFFKEKLKQIFTLHKICENTGIYWLIFSRIRTKSTISKNPYSRIFYAVLFLVFSCLFKRVFLLVLNESPYNVNLLDY